ncbi:MAG: AAA family ATPase [Bacteroidia bacterium]
MQDAIRSRSEEMYREELQALAAADAHPRPANWQLSPRAVFRFLMGGKADNGATISPKYIGSPRLIEIAVATLATERALLLLGVPGTAKTWVSEHLAAAISGDSSLLVQGTAGTGEESMRYGWNYALLLAKGPVPAALVPSPVLRAFREGKIVRVEELTRISSDVQDTLVSLLSEKELPVPELEVSETARKGFNPIATANDRDKGVNELSSALKRRFNTVVLPLPATLEEEVEIVRTRSRSIAAALALPVEPPAEEDIRRLVTIFRELRQGQSLDGRTRLKPTSATLSSAEAISVIIQGLSLSAHFGSGRLQARELAGALTGAIVKDPQQDALALREYLDTLVRDRAGWSDIYKACRELLA